MYDCSVVLLFVIIPSCALLSPYRRATAEQISRQGEVLSRAETIVDDTEYMLNKSARILRGMTWSGWVANIFSSDVKYSSSAAAAPAAASSGQPSATSTT